MAVELVDGHAGEPHIDGSDAGIFKAGVCGEEGGILATSNKCACSINSNTSITIAEGELVMPTSGRLVRVKNPETLTITTGSASQKRNDLVVARYSKDSTTEIESVSLVVLRGTPTTGTPSDPATQVGDLKLYRLSLDGLTLQTPVKLANDIMPITSLSENRVIATGTSQLGAGYISVDIKAILHPATKQIEVFAYKSTGQYTGTAGYGQGNAAFTLPEKYRNPDGAVAVCSNSIHNDQFSTGLLVAGTGTVHIYVSSGRTQTAAQGYLPCSLSYSYE